VCPCFVMAASIEFLTLDVIRAVARQTAGVASNASSAERPSSPRNKPSGQRSGGYGIAAHPPQEDYRKAYGLEIPDSAETSPDEPMPPLRTATWLQHDEEPQEVRQEPSQPGGTAFWEACERAHQLYCLHTLGSPRGSAAPSPLDRPHLPPSPGGGGLVSPPSPGFAAASSSRADSPPLTQRTLHSPRLVRSPRTPSSSSLDRSPLQATFSDLTIGRPLHSGDSGASHRQTAPKETKKPLPRGPERFFYDAASYTGTAAQHAKAQPKRQASAPCAPVRNSISVQELTERLHKDGDRYEQKRIVRREEKAKAEDIHTHQPRINRNSLIMASGVESLEVRREKITQKRAEKLEKARARQEEVADSENIGMPTITAKASRQQRGIEALHRWDDQKQQKIMQRQHQRFQEKLQECTFQPNVSASGKKISEKYGKHGDIFNDEHYVHQRLHDDAVRKQTQRAAADSPAELDSRSSASTTPRRRASPLEHSASTPSSSSAPRPAAQHNTPTRPGASKHASAGAVGPATAAGGSKPLSFEAFMRTLAAEKPSAGQRAPARWASASESAEAPLPERELAGDSTFFIEQGNGQHAQALRDRLPRHGQGMQRVQSGMGVPDTVMSDAEDEIFMAFSAPRPASYPLGYPAPLTRSGRQARSQSPMNQYRANDCPEECALPEWVKSAVPTPSVPCGGGALPSSGRSTPRQSRSSPWTNSAPLSPHSAGGSPDSAAGFSGRDFHTAGNASKRNASHSDQNVLMYTNVYDDVFRIGYGGALPGTLADVMGMQGRS